MISFNSKSKNQLLVNPKITEEEKATLIELQHEFEREFGPDDYVLVPSSGSSRKATQSVKLIALKISSVLNSANRVNLYIKATEQDHWGLVLPEFHVAGLGVFARAYLTQAKVVKLDWNMATITKQIEDNNIRYISMVPTQIFDLVEAQISAPVRLKKVFVGGGFLTADLKEKAEKLSWPLAETYGMTETSSMIAVKEKGDEWFRLMDNVDVKVENSLLHLHCDSLLTATVQKNDKKIEIQYYDNGSWYPTEDQVELKTYQSNIYLKPIGRRGDYVKVLGEGVSLSELRSQLVEIASQLQVKFSQIEITAIPDERKENELLLVFEESVSEAMRLKIQSIFNQKCRPYEKIHKIFILRQIPRTDLGKLKSDELNRIIIEKKS